MWMRRVIIFSSSFSSFFSERAARRGGGGGALPDVFFLLFFPCLNSRPRAGLATVLSSFFGLASNALNVRNNNNNNNKEENLYENVPLVAGRDVVERKK